VKTCSQALTKLIDLSLKFDQRRTLWLSAGIFFMFLCGCSSSETSSQKLFSAPESLNNPTSTISARSPSAMEAISRGIAAVTPPSAALKDISYQFDSVDLTTDAQEILKRSAEWLKDNPKVRVEIEGHCDDIGSAEYNLALGARRAQVAKDFLVSQSVPTERLVTISYGKEAPACFEPTEECRVQNRRARFVIFSEVPTS
jgi:peptidoglycan-associated lipoprotein